MVTTEEKRKQGKKNRASGAAFELKVRKDLEEKGWFVCKWQNNIDENKCISAKRKFNPFNKVMAMGTGFPDFFCYRISCNFKPHNYYEIHFVEAKSNGYMDKTEKEKAKWYLENRYCSKFLVASKIKVGRKVEVKYVEFV